ncbi:MAG: hypothetical protein ACTHK7_23100 [Aureliella sp.]
MIEPSPASTVHAENALRRGRESRTDELEPEAMQAMPTWQMAALAADLIQLALAGFLLDFLLFDGTNVGLLPRMIALAGLLLTTLRSLGWPVLMAVQLSFLIREPSHRDMLHGMHSLIVTLATIGMVAYASSFKTTRRQFRHLVAAIVHAAVHGDRTDLASRLWTPPYRALAIRIGILVAVVLVSMLVFVELPIAAAVRQRWWQKSLANGLVLWPGPGVLILALALIVVFWHIEWHPASRAQARLYLRSVFLRSHYRDLKMIVMRRLKAARNAQSESS